MDIVKMYGPSIRNPERIVNRDVPACDVEAYKAAGYKEGSIEGEEPAAELVPEKPAKKKGKK